MTESAERNTDEAARPAGDGRRTLRLFGRELRLPASRPMRVALGVALTLGGIVGFLPVLGFWMIPLGIIVLSYEFALIRRMRRRMVVRFAARQKNGRGGA